MGYALDGTNIITKVVKMGLNKLGVMLSIVFLLFVLAIASANAWTTSTIDSTTADDVGYFTSIAVGTSGAAYISYQNRTSRDLMYATNVSGSWGTTTVDITTLTGNYTSIAVGTSGAVYISYWDETSNDLKYATNVSGSWGTSTLDSIGSVGELTSIAVGTSGAVYISYYDNTNSALKYATNVSGSWVTSTLDSDGIVGKWTSIAVGTSGAVYISYYYQDQGDLKYATNVSGSWGTSTLDTGGGGVTAGEWTSIAVGSSGAVYISYYDRTNGALKYATNVSGSWGTTTVDSTGDTGQYTSIAVGSSGAAYISYYDVTGSNTMYATNVSGSWGTTTVDNTSSADTGQYTSIEVGMSGAVYISYYDVTNKNLMYAVNPTHTAVTGAASGVTTSGATLNGTANATGLNTTAYFQYGTTSGSYTGTSSTQSVSGTSDTAVSFALSGLSEGTMYYYRLANQHYTNLVYGSEQSFTPSSTEAPPTPLPETLTVISTNPANGVTNVAVTTTVSATFSMFVNGSTVTTDTFTLSDGSSLVSGVVSTNGATVTFTPSSSLAHNTTYTATLTTGIRAANFGGTQMTSNYTWSFTTTEDADPPTVSSTSPVNGAAGVAINSSITATFSETMQSSTINTNTFTVSDGSGNIGGTVSYSGTTATVPRVLPMVLLMWLLTVS